MNEMIERVAKAIFDDFIKQGGESPGAYVGNTSEFPFIGLDGGFDIGRAARAAIEAMREPTPRMALANSDASGPDDQQTINDWRAMIDASLS